MKASKTHKSLKSCKVETAVSLIRTFAVVQAVFLLTACMKNVWCGMVVVMGMVWHAMARYGAVW